MRKQKKMQKKKFEREGKDRRAHKQDVTAVCGGAPLPFVSAVRCCLFRFFIILSVRLCKTFVAADVFAVVAVYDGAGAGGILA